MRKNCPPVILENFFEPCILYLLSKESSYGYKLLEDLKKNCLCNTNTGNLYRKLSSLLKEKYIEKKKLSGTIGPDKNMYIITKTGKKHLQMWIYHLEKQKKIIESLIINYHKIYETTG